MREKVYTVAYMGVIAAVFTGMVAVLSQTTRTRIELNQRLARQRVVLQVLNIPIPKGASLEAVVRLYDDRIKTTGRTFEGQDGEMRQVLAGYDDGGNLVGYAFRTAGQGLWGRIVGYAAVDAELEELIGVRFFDHDETPGLGGEITNEWFQEQFEGLGIPPGLVAGEERIELKLPGQEKGPYDVDAITGATQTSKGVQNFLNADLRRFLTLMQSAK